MAKVDIRESCIEACGPSGDGRGGCGAQEGDAGGALSEGAAVV